MSTSTTINKPTISDQEKPEPVIPKSAASLRTLMATMAVMCYLACLAIGALLMINQAVETWTRGLSREVTVQIRETTGTNMDVKLEQAEKILRKTPGIATLDILDREQGVELLRPWLGDADLAHLPVPRLIRVTVDQTSPPDFETLAAKLKAAVDGAGLDTHQRWATELTRMATVMSSLSWLILALICLSAVAIVIFASRAVLEANNAVVDILHLVGATDSYIARQFYRRFILAGFWAGIIGLSLAAITFLAFSLSGDPAVNAVAAASRTLLYGTDTIPWRTYASLLAVPPAATIIALLTSRLTLMQILLKIQ
jgi:cell division transport system permease protein